MLHLDPELQYNDLLCYIRSMVLLVSCCALTTILYQVVNATFSQMTLVCINIVQQ